MSLYKSVQESFGLVSEWICAKKIAVTGEYWAIVYGPTVGTHTVTFPIELPAGAIIARAWVGMTFTTSPKGGIKFQRINGQDIPSNGEFDISITPDTTSFEATFSFSSYGTVESQGEYSSALGIGSPTLYVDYVDTAMGDVDNDQSGSSSGHTGSARLPRLLDAGMRETERLQAVFLSLDLKIDPLSTAELAVVREQEIPVNSFVELFCPYGSVGIFRVYRTENALCRGGLLRCSLRHGIVTLADDLVTAGNSIQAPVSQVFASLFALQTTPRWVLGTCETPDDLEIVLERSYQTLLAAFTELTAKLPDGYAWEFDQTVYPWRANLRAMPETDACEFRLSRNLEKLTISVDRDEQCNRLYAFGAGEGNDRIGLESLIGTPYMDADNTSAEIVAKQITRDDIFDALTLKDVASRYLEKHKNPSVSIEADAADVYHATGLPFDRFHMGKVCRVPLPAYGITIRERVVGISWRDVIGAPKAVKAYLSDRIRDATDELAELIRESTSAKLIGGTVVSAETKYNNDSVTQSSSLVHYFSINGYGNALSVQAKYTPAGNCRLMVDGTTDVPSEAAESGIVDILRYLASDENGVPTVGEHNVQYFARGTATLSVSSTITIKTIEKR